MMVLLSRSRKTAERAAQALGLKSGSWAHASQFSDVHPGMSVQWQVFCHLEPYTPSFELTRIAQFLREAGLVPVLFDLEAYQEQFPPRPQPRF